jgi:hypothetical protein
MQVPDDIEVRLIDIADDDTLLALYGLHIPVLQRTDSMMELHWPFSVINIIEFIK